MRRLTSERGFTLIEALIALTLILFAIVVTVQTIDSSRKLTNTSESKAVAAKVGEQELERVLALPFDSVALSANPAQDNTQVPLSYIVPNGTPTPVCVPTSVNGWNEFSSCCPSLANTANCYRWDQSATGQPYDEPIVVNATANAGSAGPTNWTDGHLSGKLYRIVTWVDDPATATTVQDYKRIVVEVTVNGATTTGGQVAQPVVVSSLTTSPNT